MDLQACSLSPVLSTEGHCHIHLSRWSVSPAATVSVGKTDNRNSCQQKWFFEIYSGSTWNWIPTNVHDLAECSVLENGIVFKAPLKLSKSKCDRICEEFERSGRGEGAETTSTALS
ncbi:hypothetical protein J6590_006290 [Homalodisca vitripennis]|nr:hypothetical protein J6590_006290 [Homalodisca vitripennis]